MLKTDYQASYNAPFDLTAKAKDKKWIWAVQTRHFSANKVISSKDKEIR